MNDLDVISYISDEMLKNPDTDVRFVSAISKLATEDSTAYDLMVDWMEEVDQENRFQLERDMMLYLMDRGLYN